MKSKNKQIFWIGKTSDDVLGNKKRESHYILSSLAKTEKEANGMASFMSGFGGYEIVKIEIKEIKE